MLMTDRVLETRVLGFTRNPGFGLAKRQVLNKLGIMKYAKFFLAHFMIFHSRCYKTLKNHQIWQKKLGDKMKQIIIQPIKYSMEIPKPEIQVFLGT